MRKIEINDVFKEEYLTCGASYDNCIFENCPIELIQEAQKMLSVKNYGVSPCNVTLTRDDEIKVEKTLENCITDYQKTLLTRDFITALVMREVLKDIPEKGAPYAVVKQQIKAYYENEFWKVKQYHATSFFPSEVRNFHKNYKRLEVNFFLVDTENKELQKAINNFISAREPYCVKVFTTNKRLPSYVDEGGNLIQPPHDYLNINPNSFISFSEENTFDYNV